MIYSDIPYWFQYGDVDIVAESGGIGMCSPGYIRTNSLLCAQQVFIFLRMVSGTKMELSASPSVTRQALFSMSPIGYLLPSSFPGVYFVGGANWL